MMLWTSGLSGSLLDILGGESAPYMLLLMGRLVGGGIAIASLQTPEIRNEMNIRDSIESDIIF